MRMRMMMLWLCFLTSVALNVFLLAYQNRNHEQKHGWSRRAAEEAEAVAAFNCSGHGRAYLDGDGPVCECNQCYEGPHCSFLNFSHRCVVDAYSGDPMYLEPFWMRKQNAESSAVVIAGWHRMSYFFQDLSYISPQLVLHIRRLHSLVNNAVVHSKHIVLGTGSTQLISAAVFALSIRDNLSSPAQVVATAPYYPVYETQTDYFRTARFEFGGEASSLNKASGDVIEVVTSPNNPDAQLMNRVLTGPNVKAVYDRAYYWPHYTAIPAPADEDLMLFTLSKVTGHAGSRLGWAIVKDKQVSENMKQYIKLAEIGSSKETQLRALQLIKSFLRQGDGKQIFRFAYETMSNRWEKLGKIMSSSKRFSIQQIPPQFCIFSDRVREASPAYAWVKCEREEDRDCCAVLRAANIVGRAGSLFGSDDRYVRLSLLKIQDDFDLLLRRLSILVSQEQGGSRADSM
ncbi:tryptophan aminotransferase-related protein 4-like [Andrographis paniculata]|uniref:tryptophan aminotransferase-related protein 4-like n=1 Tax=Andrographis paniculata TaxID=175694 RepID=UPI0021E8AA4D|nr:tryptophan aminotransferase-related protein 4-like [Andrographis paniculata]